jgi:hypothetical protein
MPRLDRIYAALREARTPVSGLGAGGWAVKLSSTAPSPPSLFAKNHNLTTYAKR